MSVSPPVEHALDQSRQHLICVLQALICSRCIIVFELDEAITFASHNAELPALRDEFLKTACSFNKQ